MFNTNTKTNTDPNTNTSIPIPAIAGLCFWVLIDLTWKQRRKWQQISWTIFLLTTIFFEVGGRKRLRIPFFKDSKLLSPTYIKADIFTLMIAYSVQQGRKMMQDQFLIPATLKLCPNTTLGLGIAFTKILHSVMFPPGRFESKLRLPNVRYTMINMHFGVSSRTIWYSSRFHTSETNSAKMNEKSWVAKSADDS